MKEMENAVPRPSTFDGYTCDPTLKARLQEHIAAARIKGVLPPHMLFSGQPGTGKTTIAMIMAKTLGLPVFKYVGQELKKASQMKELLKTPESGAMLFIDEIHSVSKEVAELLYPIMEDRQMASPTDSTLTLYLNPIIVVGATTEPGSLEKPLLDRFSLKFTIPAYTDLQMIEIVETMVGKMGSCPYNMAAIMAIALRSKNVPRLAGNLIYQVNDYALVNNIKEVGHEIVSEVLTRNGITEDGLDETDRKIIETLQQHDTLGLNTLATFIGEDPAWVSKVYEPYLMRTGYLTRGQRGRQLTDKGRAIKFC
jgi:Holliday junction DNA helicase RuvB